MSINEGNVLAYVAKRLGRTPTDREKRIGIGLANEFRDASRLRIAEALDEAFGPGGWASYIREEN